MRHLAVVIAAIVPLAGCVDYAPTTPLNVSRADVARCNYESQAAAGSGYGVAGAIDAAARSGHLQRLCLEAASAAREETAAPALPAWCERMAGGRIGCDAHPL